MTYTGYHPMGNAAPMGPPNQFTVDESGEANNDNPGYEKQPGIANAAVANLPHPDARPLEQGNVDYAYDPLDLLDHITMINGKIDAMMRCLTLVEDESIKRRMRGPLKGSATFDANGNAVVQLGPVPPGEIWLLDRYIVTTDSDDTTTCRLFDGGVNDPSSELDFTLNGNEAVSDNTQPVLLFPHTYVSFAWSGGSEHATAWARVNYRCIEENAAFANALGDTNQ